LLFLQRLNVHFGRILRISVAEGHQADEVILIARLQQDVALYEAESNSMLWCLVCIQLFGPLPIVVICHCRLVDDWRADAAVYCSVLHGGVEFEVGRLLLGFIPVRREVLVAGHWGRCYGLLFLLVLHFIYAQIGIVLLITFDVLKSVLALFQDVFDFLLDGHLVLDFGGGLWQYSWRFDLRLRVLRRQ